MAWPKKGDKLYPLVKRFTSEARRQLIASSRLFTTLFISHFPRIYHYDWNPQLDLDKLEVEQNNFQELVNSVFQIIEKHGDILIIKDLYSFINYSICGLPTPKLRYPLLLDGTIGRRVGSTLWEWHFTEGVYPEKARSYRERLWCSPFVLHLNE